MRVDVLLLRQRALTMSKNWRSRFAFALPVHSSSTGPNYRPAMGEKATIEAAGRRRGPSRHHPMVCGPAGRVCGQNYGCRGLFTRNLAPSGPEGMTFEGPYEARFAWELVVLPSG